MIRLENISVTFNPGTADEVGALRSISLHMVEGDFITVIGTNGSGKSTLLNVIAGKIIPDSGRVVVGGKDITKLPVWKRAGMISRVFQDPFLSTAADMTIEENMLMAWLRGKPRYPRMSLTGKLRNHFRERLNELEMGLEDRLHAPAGSLSGGQRQAVTLLMAVLRKPSVLLLDEHTAALDPKTALQVGKLTTRFVEKYKLTAMMVTHSMKQALEMGNRTLMLHGGRIIADIPRNEKEMLTTEDLLGKFEEIRRREKLTADMLGNFRRQYV
jgi:putative ABC transport system ATP-binding protein